MPTVIFVLGEVFTKVIGVNAEDVPIGKTAVEDEILFNVSLPVLEASI